MTFSELKNGEYFTTKSGSIWKKIDGNHAICLLTGVTFLIDKNVEVTKQFDKLREILFRGKAINREKGREYRTNYNNGDWVYGLITKRHDEEYNSPAEMRNEWGVNGIEVDYQSIGQYIGLKDKHGNKIFEGDIVRVLAGVEAYGIYEFDKNITVKDIRDLTMFENADSLEIIGNIYDNPELLEE